MPPVGKSRFNIKKLPRPEPSKPYSTQWSETQPKFEEKGTLTGIQWMDDDLLVGCTTKGWIVAWRISNDEVINVMEEAEKEDEFIWSQLKKRQKRNEQGLDKLDQQHLPCFAVLVDNASFHCLQRLGNDIIAISALKQCESYHHIKKSPSSGELSISMWDGLRISGGATEKVSVRDASGSEFNEISQEDLKRIEQVDMGSFSKHSKFHVGMGLSGKLSGDTIVCGHDKSIIFRLKHENRADFETIKLNEIPILKLQEHVWITDMKVHSDFWWTVCGGTSKQGRKGGFVATWFGRDLLACTLTRETPCSLSQIDKERIWTVGNEGVLTEWEFVSCKKLRRLWITPPAGTAMTTKLLSGTEFETTNITAIGGVGNAVDVFSGQSMLKSLRIS